MSLREGGGSSQNAAQGLLFLPFTWAFTLFMQDVHGKDVSSQFLNAHTRTMRVLLGMPFDYKCLILEFPHNKVHENGGEMLPNKDISSTPGTRKLGREEE